MPKPAKKRKKESEPKSKKPKYLSGSKVKGIVGLKNLGNTCYMNSCLQVMAQLPELVQYFIVHKIFLDDLNEQN